MISLSKDYIYLFILLFKYQNFIYLFFLQKIIKASDFWFRRSGNAVFCIKASSPFLITLIYVRELESVDN